MTTKDGDFSSPDAPRETGEPKSIEVVSTKNEASVAKSQE